MKTKSVQLNLRTNCRVCLENSENMISIFIKEDNQTLAERISDCGGIEIEYNSNKYPDKICPNCMTYLNVAYKFRTMCKTSDDFLKALLEKTEEEIEALSISTAALFNAKQDREPHHGKSEGEIMYNVTVKNDDELQNHEENAMIVTSNNDIDDAREINSENTKVILKVERCDEYDIEDNKIMYDLLEDDIKEDYMEFEENTKTIVNNDNDFDEKTKKKTKKKTAKKKIKKDDGESSKPIKLEEPKIFMCEICGNKYEKMKLLKSHLTWHNQDLRHQCELCGRKFQYSVQVTRHMRVHTGDKPYSCTECGKKFSDGTACKRHIRTHTGERPYVCQICGKAFTYSDTLKFHMVVHTGERPYPCDKCGKKFARKHHLKAHTQTLSYKSNKCVVETQRRNKTKLSIIKE